MEENKLDIYQIIGFLFLIAAVFYWFNVTIPNLEQNALDEKEIISQTQNEEINDNLIKDINEDVSSSLNSTFINSNLENQEVVIENDDVIFKFNTKGGSLAEIQLKDYVDYKGDDLFLIKNNNQDVSLSFELKNGNIINTSDYNFTYEMERQGKMNVLKMSLIVSNGQSISFEYKIPESGYMIDFNVKSSGFSSLINSNSNVNLNWNLDAFRQAKSIDYENRYSQLMYQYDGDDTDYLSSYTDSDDSEDSVSWISYGQHFFNSILILDSPVNNVQFESKKLFEDESKEAKFTKKYSSIIPLNLSGSEINSQMKWYFGPNDYDILKQYQNKIYDSIYFGWGIFGMINRFIYFPFFGFLSKYFSAGLAVILMTIATRLVMSPVTYKTYVSQARMKVIKPEITELNEKFKNDAVKRQQETMKLYNKAGANPLLGCVPALLQLPVFYALFCFFPIAFQLRGKSFLWAEDLSSYDTIAELPFSIPFYGDHISLLPILASIAIFFYTKMSSGAQMQTSQPGMPNMKFIMYLMPVMMLFFFNNYASAFSLYYFISNILTILIMISIKYFIIDEEKIRLQVQENKKKPTKQNRFQRKMQEMMEEADKQRKLQGKK
ncbi:membrane protein insertase YidC [Flavobacteriaceae bacterium]|jgi:YidC/Oxa1 family membrane protein insertase|nr:membrane protein insertase YidC [Flavobacteriaceae bacterium]MDB2567317.1 membrane protein insertase YidC [Flavobacteriaceae bacterium]MDB4601470.1 membrane protein insertase YidC [Flavobacteriaceae bacterium]MDC3182294.1 membrane protein insertase YidC [Flavobacteriaceae bacterium]MDC3227642.1 membrane protein insertase YidC [Flavobacteriaceae bacterium]|tara:strand:+ start:20723 stop:22543 length:1821 start_codon:yes stop_codon:yes gene_type:complete